MDWSAFIGMVMDMALGAMAYRLARSLERTQIQQTEILRELTRRVDKLEGIKEDS
jgi:uncharacterized membrane-anchored protein YhcB (DUF1043 family)